MPVVCMQKELPPQDSGNWPEDGRLYLAEPGRSKFPNPFVRYRDDALEVFSRDVNFVHYPVQDLSTPDCPESFNDLLGDLLDRIGQQDARLYVHCWGGRGRAGIVGACLLALLRPELDAQEVLRITQTAYDTRPGARTLTGSFARSPQTEEQRAFVADFVTNLHRIREAA